MAHLGEVRGTLGTIESLGGRVLAVSFASPTVTAQYAREQALPFPLASDEARMAYRDYGLGRGSRWAVYRPGAVWQHFVLRARGMRPSESPRDDVYQLGGDFVIGRDGRLRLAHASRAGDDRPGMQAIVAAMRAG